MTPQERLMISDLFDRLAKLENAPRDAEASAAIAQGLRNAPNAVYALVQTVLVQDEAIKLASHRIEQLEAANGAEQKPSGGFLDSMRDAVFGQSQAHGSVPNVRPPEMGNRPVWNSGQVMQQADPYNRASYGQPYGSPQAPAQSPFGGGSFLGTAAAAAAGMVGGSLLMGSIRSMMGGGGYHQSFGDTAGFGRTETQGPWNDQSDSQLARDAGINDIASSGQGADDGPRAGLFDQAATDDDQDDMNFDSDDFGGNGDSDFA